MLISKSKTVNLRTGDYGTELDSAINFLLAGMSGTVKHVMITPMPTSSVIVIVTVIAEVKDGH
jgi:hypothetical protein